MSNIIAGEEDRVSKFHEVFGAHGLNAEKSIVPGRKYNTDGDIHHKGYRYVIVEAKAEIRSKGAEPFLQAACYYREFTRVHATKKEGTGSPLPCILIYLFGVFSPWHIHRKFAEIGKTRSHVALAGATLTDRPNIQTLSDALPLFWHNTDTTQWERTARCLGALKKAIEALKYYYEVTCPKLEALPPTN